MPKLLRELYACRLCWNVTVAVFAFILAVESVLLVPSAQRFERVELERLAARAEIAIESVLAAGRGLADEAALARDLSAVAGRREIESIALFRPDGSFAAAAGANPASHLPEGVGTLDDMAHRIERTEDGSRLTVAWRSQAPGAPAIVARLESGHVSSELLAYTLRIAGLVAIIVLVVTAGTMLVLHAWVLRPLLRLHHSAMEAAADPDRAPEFAVPSRRRDEIGQLLRAYNGMLERVAESKRRDREIAEERARYLSHHDVLTGLPNRAALLEFLDRRREPGNPGAGRVTLYLVNIVQFRLLNAGLGPRRGDELLRRFARRLQRAAEPGDFVAHLGADRFAVARAGESGGNAAAEFAERIVRETGDAYELEGSGRMSVSVRVGIAHGQGEGLDGEELLGQAELALGRARAEEGSEYQFFSPQLAEEARTRQSLIRDLERALEAGELFPVLQPRLSLEPDGATKLAGAEALLRWRHPVRGMVSPGEFIPLAEATGLIVPVGEFVLHAACRQIRAWLDRYGWSPSIAVNLSARQFTLPDLEQRLEFALGEHRVPVELLEVEVTETAAMRNVARSAETLAALRSLGVRVSIDDFGTGYSSLNYLRRFAVDAIKIDKSFVDDIGADRHAEAICEAILRLGQSLGTKVIAEGVENERQAAFLRRRNCDEAQGFLFGKPLPVEEFERVWIAARATA